MFTFENFIEKLIENNSNKICFDLKIFRWKYFNIEKILNSFVEKGYLIIDYDNFLPIKISIKKHNNNLLLTKDDLKYSLNEAIEECKKTFEKKSYLWL